MYPLLWSEEAQRGRAATTRKAVPVEEILGTHARIVVHADCRQMRPAIPRASVNRAAAGAAETSSRGHR